jgi:hypothetical protein
MKPETLLVLLAFAYIGSVALWGWFMSMIYVPYTDYTDMLTFHFKTTHWYRLLTGIILLLLAPLFLGLAVVAYALLIVAERTGFLEWLDSR